MSAINKTEFDKLMKELYPDKYIRESVIKGAKIATCLVEYHKDKTKNTEKKLDNAIKEAKEHLKQGEQVNERRNLD